MKTVSMRRTIAAPIDEVFDWLVDGTNWASVPGMIYSRVSPADGPEPHGVGSVREFATWASKGTEVITAFERPHHMGYRALSTIPPSQHEGGSITLQEVPGGTEVFWTSTGRLKAPVLSDSLTRLFAPLIKMGMVNVTRAAERALTGRPDVR
jgi:hypothetical protein